MGGQWWGRDNYIIIMCWYTLVGGRTRLTVQMHLGESTVVCLCLDNWTMIKRFSFSQQNQHCGLLFAASEQASDS